ncbi:MAG: PDZ domain-containing protein [Zetaproteobacteria bacterium]|nr:PDZ domain-containing protein [Zetaproteobacteria bacterium]
MPRFITLLELLTVLATAWWVAGLILPATPDNMGKKTMIAASITEDQPTAQPPKKDPLKVALFGQVSVAQVAESIAVAKPVQVAPTVSLSQLGMKLLGTIVSGDHSLAIIKKNAATAQQVFHVDEPIQPGIVLKTIETQRVILDVRGHLEALWLESFDPAAVSSSVGVAKPIDANSGAKKVQVDRTMINNALQNMPQLMSEVSIVPFFQQGVSEGFMVASVKQGSVIERVGIMSGDVLREVNGQPVKSMDQALALYNQLKDASSLDVTLLRAGQEMRVHYDIQ